MVALSDITAEWVKEHLPEVASDLAEPADDDATDEEATDNDEETATETAEADDAEASDSAAETEDDDATTTAAGDEPGEEDEDEPMSASATPAPGVLVVDIGIAQRVLGMPDQVSRLLLGTQPGPARPPLAAIVGDRLRLVEAGAPSDLERLTGAPVMASDLRASAAPFRKASTAATSLIGYQTRRQPVAKRRLQHDAVAGNHRRPDLPAGDEQREIPGDDPRDHAERFAADPDQPICIVLDRPLGDFERRIVAKIALRPRNLALRFG